ncbi:MAG: hypothetical protein E7390_03915 [Ruminococcaceae bacterium]|nr:hypothetical protein [Oscillospiraceae bacterium]
MKKLALLLAVLLLCTVIPVMADSTEEMAAAIAIVKSRVDIPAECTEFLGRQDVYDGKKSWNFSWETTEDAEKRMYVSVTLRSGDLLESVNVYVQEDAAYRPGKTLPVISQEQALQTAVAYAAKMNPAFADQYAAEAVANLSGDRYSVRIPRMVGGIPVYNNSASIWVCSQTGRVERYDVNHDDTAVFSGTEGAMNIEAAQSAYIQNGYMRLEYRIFEEEARLVYVPGQTESLLDAATGKGFNPFADEAFGRNDKNAAAEETLMSGDAASGASATLTPQERKVIEEMAGLLSYEQAVEKLKSVPYFRIPADAVLQAGNTYKTEEERYILRISLSGKDEDNYSYTYGELDGQTGEILQFYTGGREEEQGTVNEEAAKEIYDAFATDYLASYTPVLAEKKTEVGEKSVYITAERTENGIPVNGDGVSVTVSPDGKIISYYLNWKQNVSFQSPGGILSAEAAYGILFANGAPRLSYYAGNARSAVIYVLADRGYAFIDAAKGTLLNYNGTPYVKKTAAAYTDVAGHYAEEAILALASIDARLGDATFQPDKVITQAEFVGLVSSCIMDYYPITGGVLDEARLYSYAVNRGVLAADEEAPDAPLTRELAVSYLLRAMDYGRFAEIEGIFRCDFADADAINSELYGYVAIAKGLGLVKGDGDGNFAPARQMTRGEAAVLIYNYLK